MWSSKLPAMIWTPPGAFRSKHRRSDCGRQTSASSEAGPRHQTKIEPAFAADPDRTHVGIGLRPENAVAGLRVACENGKIGLACKIIPVRCSRAAALASSFGI